MRGIGAAQGAAIATAINVDNMLVHVCLELGRARQAHGFALQVCRAPPSTGRITALSLPLTMLILLPKSKASIQ